MQGNVFVVVVIYYSKLFPSYEGLLTFTSIKLCLYIERVSLFSLLSINVIFCEYVKNT